MKFLPFCAVVLDEDKRLAKRRLIEHNRELKRIKELKHGFSDCHRHEEECNQEKQGLISTIVQAYNLAMASSTFEVIKSCFAVKQHTVFIGNEPNLIKIYN